MNTKQKRFDDNLIFITHWEEKKILFKMMIERRCEQWACFQRLAIHWILVELIRLTDERWAMFREFKEYICVECLWNDKLYNLTVELSLPMWLWFDQRKKNTNRYFTIGFSLLNSLRSTTLIWNNTAKTQKTIFLFR